MNYSVTNANVAFLKELRQEGKSVDFIVLVMCIYRHKAL